MTKQETPNNPHVLSVKRRLVWVSLLIICGVVLFLFITYHSFFSSLVSERKAQTKSLSAAATGIIKRFYEHELTGSLPPSEAKKYAMQALESATYGNTGYFWINSGSGVLLMQPYTPDKVGNNEITWTDVDGKYIFDEFITKAKTGGGWVSYKWPKPKTKIAYSKISYVTYFEPWDWVIGTGVYLDDLHENIFWVVIKSSGMLFIIVFIFISGSVAAINVFTHQLENIAMRDGLTLLYSKLFLTEIIPSILEKHTRLKDKELAAVFIDIDDFKHVNDKYGHDLGDKVLMKLSEIMLASTRPDDYCVRYGGEEMILIGFVDDIASSIVIIERIRKTFCSLEFGSGDSIFKVTLSAGVAIYDKDKETFEETIIRADKKMYESKQSGKNRISF